MNEQMILKMASPFVKDGYLTYEQFNAIYNMLSRKEQYQVIDILRCCNIELIDEEEQEEAEDIQQLGADQKEESSEVEIESIYEHVNGLFVEPASSFEHSRLDDSGIKQSNEILCYLLQQGNRHAAQDLCIKNRRLVMKFALSYYHFFGNDLEMEDLEQAGYIGLLRAAQSFDITMGTCFTTYAVYWIRQSISRQLGETGYSIRLPVHIEDFMKKVVRLEAEFENMGIEFEDRLSLIAEELGCSEKKIRECIDLRMRYRKTISLDMMIGEDESTALSDLVPDASQATPEEVVINRIQNEALMDALNQLSKRERNIIILRYGINGVRPLTLEEIGKMYNVTRECIRQIQEKAIRKLRRFHAIKALAG